MSKCVVMESAFVGAIRGIRDRIDKAIVGSEVWRYQLGSAPSYVGNTSVIDEDDPDNDSIDITFFNSPWDIYDYRLRIVFLDYEGVVDVMIIDVGLDENRFNVMPDYSLGEDPAGDVQMVDNGEAFVFYPVEDLCSVLSALSFITVGETLHAELANRTAIAAEEKKIRRARFKVIDGSKDT